MLKKASRDYSLNKSEDSSDEKTTASSLRGSDYLAFDI